jgi:hypothetical protein
MTRLTYELKKLDRLIKVLFNFKNIFNMILFKKKTIDTTIYWINLSQPKLTHQTRNLSYEIF